MTEADVEEVMAKIRPLLKSKQKLSDQAKLKYQFLVQINKKESPKPKPVFSMEVEVVNVKEIQNELLNEKLVEVEAGEFKVTELGQRFVAEFEKVDEKK